MSGMKADKASSPQAPGPLSRELLTWREPETPIGGLSCLPCFASALCSVFLAPAVAHTATLENPGNGSFYSGIGVISGWKCSANGPLTVRFNGGNPLPLAYFNDRPDTCSVCGDTNNGFVALWNWANLGDGLHTAVVYDNGVEFARSTFEVTTLGEEFAGNRLERLRGDRAGQYSIRVSRGWRICFTWRVWDAFEVELNNHYD